MSKKTNKKVQKGLAGVFTSSILITGTLLIFGQRQNQTTYQEKQNQKNGEIKTENKAKPISDLLKAAYANPYGEIDNKNEFLKFNGNNANLLEKSQSFISKFGINPKSTLALEDGIVVWDKENGFLLFNYDGTLQRKSKNNTNDPNLTHLIGMQFVYEIVYNQAKDLIIASILTKDTNLALVSMNSQNLNVIDYQEIGKNILEVDALDPTHNQWSISPSAYRAPYDDFLLYLQGSAYERAFASNSSFHVKVEASGKFKIRTIPKLSLASNNTSKVIAAFIFSEDLINNKISIACLTVVNDKISINIGSYDHDKSQDFSEIINQIQTRTFSVKVPNFNETSVKEFRKIPSGFGPSNWTNYIEKQIAGLSIWNILISSKSYTDKLLTNTKMFTFGLQSSFEGKVNIDHNSCYYFDLDSPNLNVDFNHINFNPYSGKYFGYGKFRDKSDDKKFDGALLINGSYSDYPTVNPNSIRESILELHPKAHSDCEDVIFLPITREYGFKNDRFLSLCPHGYKHILVSYEKKAYKPHSFEFAIHTPTFLQINGQSETEKSNVDVRDIFPTYNNESIRQFFDYLNDPKIATNYPINVQNIKKLTSFRPLGEYEILVVPNSISIVDNYLELSIQSLASTYKGNSDWYKKNSLSQANQSTRIYLKLALSGFRAVEDLRLPDFSALSKYLKFSYPSREQIFGNFNFNYSFQNFPKSKFDLDTNLGLDFNKEFELRFSALPNSTSSIKNVTLNEINNFYRNNFCGLGTLEPNSANLDFGSLSVHYDLKKDSQFASQIIQESDQFGKTFNTLLINSTIFRWPKFEKTNQPQSYNGLAPILEKTILDPKWKHITQDSSRRGLF